LPFAIGCYQLAIFVDKCSQTHAVKSIASNNRSQPVLHGSAAGYLIQTALTLCSFSFPIGNHEERSFSFDSRSIARQACVA
jgi:hypothetical protein